MIIPNKHNGYSADGSRLYFFGGGQPTYTESKVTNSNIPEYAQPYVENMLGAAQKQVYQADGTTFQPYKAYGGTYDAQGNQTSYDPSKGIAGFQPMQTQAQQGVQGMQVPGQFDTAMTGTQNAANSLFNTAGQAGGYGAQGFGAGMQGMGYGMQAANAGNQYAQQATNPYAAQAYMSPYMQNVVDIQKREAGRQSDIQGTQQQAQATQAGAFGGGRDAIMRAERERNLGTQMNDIQAQGSQNAFQQAQQAQQFGANLGLQGMQAGIQGAQAGMQGAQTGLQGVNAQQAGYGQAMQGANQLSNIANQQLQAQQGIYGLQNQYGAQQQALEQSKLNQAQQDYANAQQYPMMQLGSLSNMLRGLPMQASSTNMYQAQPNALTQGIGAAGTAASLYNAYNNPNSSPNAPKTMAAGGITSIPRYDVGGQVMSQLEQMDDRALENEAKTSPSPRIREMAQAILKQRQAGMDTAPQMDMAPPPQQDMGMAGGGIIAFAKGDKVKYQTTASQEKDRERAEDRAALLKYPAAAADLVALPARAALNLIGGTGANLANRTINAVTGTDLDTNYGPGYDYGEYLNAVQKPTRTGPDGRATTATDPRVKAAANTPLDMSGIKAAVPAPVETPPAAPKAGPAPASSDEPIYTGTERSPEFLRTMEEQAAAGNFNSADLLQAYYKKFPKAVAPAVDPNSIMAAAQVDPLAASQAAVDSAQALGDKSVLDRIKENAEARKALGLDQNEAQQEYMKSTMAQKANIAADAEQKKYLRLAEFFASWGSTPGDTLVAGMKAVKEKIPDMIGDIKEQRKAMADADKVLYELGQADRKEKLGQFDEATKQKEEAAKIAMQLQTHLSTARASIEHARTTAGATVTAAQIGERSHRYTAEVAAAAGIRGHEIASTSQDLATRGRAASDELARSGQKEGRDLVFFNHQTDQLRDLSGKLSAVLNTAEAQKLTDVIIRAKLVPDNKELQTQAEAARAQIATITKPIEDQIKTQKANVDMAGRKVFGTAWITVSAPASSNTTDPLGIR